MRLPAKLALVSIVTCAALAASVGAPASGREPVAKGFHPGLSAPAASAYDSSPVTLSATLADLVRLRRGAAAQPAALVVEPEPGEAAGATPVWGDVTGRVHFVNARFRVF